MFLEYESKGNTFGISYNTSKRVIEQNSQPEGNPKEFPKKKCQSERSH